MPEYNDNPSFWLKIVIALLGVFAFIQVYSVQSILPQLQTDLNASVIEVGNTVGITVFAVALISPFIGMLSDAFGRKWLIVASVFLLTIPTALMFQVESIEGLLLLRFIQGIAVPGVSVVAVAYIGEEFRSPTMIRLVTIYITGCVMGGFLGRFLLGHLVEFMTWRHAFGVMAVLSLLGAFAILKGLPASKNFVPNHRISNSLSTLWQLLRNPSLQAACALGFTVLFALVGEFTFVNLHLAAAPYNFSSGDLANIFTVYLLGVVITPIAGRIIPKIGARKTILMSVAVSAVGAILTLSGPSWMIVTALALSACGVFITQSATMSFIAFRVTKGRSQASGLYYSAYYCGGFAGAWFCGLAYDLGQWPATVVVLVATLAVGWCIAWKFMPNLAD